MSTLEVGSVAAALRHVLKGIEDAAATHGVTLPERRYTTTGGAVYDCAQVSVSGNALAIGLAGNDQASQFYAGQCAPGWTITVDVAIVRGAAEKMVGRRGTVAPTVDMMQADTTQADADAAVLVEAIQSIAGPDIDQLGLAPANILFGEVAGGLTAVVLSTTINLWDVPPEDPDEGP